MTMKNHAFRGQLVESLEDVKNILAGKNDETTNRATIEEFCVWFLGYTELLQSSKFVFGLYRTRVAPVEVAKDNLTYAADQIPEGPRRIALEVIKEVYGS